MSFPGLSEDQSWAKSWAEGGTTSGCQACHDSKDADSFFKSTGKGQSWKELNGPAIKSDGIPTNNARNFYIENKSF